MFVNVGCELCSSEAVSHIILHYFSALSPIWSISFLLLLEESESLSAKGVNTNFLFDYAVLYFCCNLGTAPSRRTRRDSARFIKTSHATANGIHKADTVVFDVCQSKWTINAKYKHSSMLISLLGSLMAPVGSVKCVLKNCSTGQPNQHCGRGPVDCQVTSFGIVSALHLFYCAHCPPTFTQSSGSFCAGCLGSPGAPRWWRLPVSPQVLSMPLLPRVLSYPAVHLKRSSSPA